VVSHLELGAHSEQHSLVPRGKEQHPRQVTMAAQGAGADAGAPQLVTRRALQELVRQIDPQERLTPEVEEVGVARVPPPVRHRQFPRRPMCSLCPWLAAAARSKAKGWGLSRLAPLASTSQIAEESTRTHAECAAACVGSGAAGDSGRLHREHHLLRVCVGQAPQVGRAGAEGYFVTPGCVLCRPPISRVCTSAQIPRCALLGRLCWGG